MSLTEKGGGKRALRRNSVTRATSIQAYATKNSFRRVLQHVHEWQGFKSYLCVYADVLVLCVTSGNGGSILEW